MNSTQQSMRMSRASRVRVRGGGRISVAILVTVAGGERGVSWGFFGGGGERQGGGRFGWVRVGNGS